MAQEDTLTMSEVLPDIVIKTEESCDSWQEKMKMMDDELRSIERLFKYLLNKAENFQRLLVCRGDYLQNECFARVVPTFLHVCKPLFSYLESTARSSLPQHTYIRSRLLDFSQKLCTCLERLILTYGSYNVFSLDESHPESISYFFIGQCQIGSTTISIFRYCQPTLYLAGVNTGLYKRMRWNVKRPQERPPQQQQQQQETEGGGTVGQTEREMEDMPVAGKAGAFTTDYYFLCYEDVPEKSIEGNVVEGDSEEPVATGNVVRMWYIGQWVQTLQKTEDFYDWILSGLPKAQFHKLLCLGEEPSTCTATDRLLEALLCSSPEGCTVLH